MFKVYYVLKDIGAVTSPQALGSEYLIFSTSFLELPYAQPNRYSHVYNSNTTLDLSFEPLKT